MVLLFYMYYMFYMYYVWKRNVSPKLWYLNTWFPVGGAFWGVFGGTALLEEVCHWGVGWALRFIPWPSSLLSLFYVYCEKCELSASCYGCLSCVLLPWLHTMMESYPCGTVSQNKLFLLASSIVHGILSWQQEKQLVLESGLLWRRI